MYGYDETGTGAPKYTGSVQDASRLPERHAEHLREDSPFGDWLRSFCGIEPQPRELVRVDESIAVLHCVEDYYIAARATNRNGGFNRKRTKRPTSSAELGCDLFSVASKYFKR